MHPAFGFLYSEIVVVDRLYMQKHSAGFDRPGPEVRLGTSSIVQNLQGGSEHVDRAVCTGICEGRVYHFRHLAWGRSIYTLTFPLFPVDCWAY